jgi:predicted Zn-dependent peptidase
VVFEEIRRAQDNPSALAQNEFLKLVFTVSPLQRDVLGPIERVQSIPIETILAYRDQRYVSGNMAVAAVGNIDHESAVAGIASAFRNLRHGLRTIRPPVPEPAQTEMRRLELGEGGRLSEIRLGWPVPGADDHDSSAIVVLEDILGQTHRRLSREVRDRRSLALSVSSGYLQFSDAGALALGATALPDNEQETIDALLAEVQRLRDGDVTDAEVQTSIRAIAGRNAVYEESNGALATRVLAELTGDSESTAEFLALLQTVTAAEVQRVARAYLNPAAYTLVIVRS